MLTTIEEGYNNKRFDVRRYLSSRVLEYNDIENYDFLNKNIK